jgi:hypothetical protein
MSEKERTDSVEIPDLEKIMKWLEKNCFSKCFKFKVKWNRPGQDNSPSIYDLKDNSIDGENKDITNWIKSKNGGKGSGYYFKYFCVQLYNGSWKSLQELREKTGVEALKPSNLSMLAFLNLYLRGGICSKKDDKKKDDEEKNIFKKEFNPVKSEI